MAKSTKDHLKVVYRRLASLLTDIETIDGIVDDILVDTDAIDGDRGASIAGRAVTDILHVSPDGSGADGNSWASAYTTIEDALDAASTDGDACTLILMSPHATYYDINTTGDPTWSGNYILSGSYRNWAKIKNDHASATSVLKFTGKVALENLTIDCGSGSNNGLIISGSGTKGSILECVYLECEDVTGAQTAIEVSGGTEYIRFDRVKVHGVVANTKGLLLDNCKLSNFEWVDLHECLTGTQLTNVASDSNIFSHILFNTCTLALDIDAGNNQLFHEISFGNCTTNVDDEVGDHSWIGIHGESDISIYPDNFAGSTVATHANPATWGTDTEVRAAATATAPFKVVGVHAEANANEKFRIRFSHDSGLTHYDDILIEGVANAVKREAIAAPSGTEHIFNKGTKISASAKSESGGNSTVVWIEIQEI